MNEISHIRGYLKPGESSAMTIYCNNYRERLRFAWHFFKVAASFLKPSRKSVTSNIIQGPIPLRQSEGEHTEPSP